MGGPTSPVLRIGHVAERANVNVQTLRYYERRGLIPAPRRRPSGYREYPDDTVRLVRFIKRAQELGFTLNDVQELIELRQNRTKSRAQVRALAAAKVSDITVRVRRLNAMRHALEDLLGACDCDAAARECPIIEALEDGGRT
ncbi:MAG TPA: MerR family transcriptional regulator [Gemmatimonadaceae bacterium]|jgi:Hg(II)-responsive transcriptional regulator|nr:MerR family transcriptional regulator [Gemmatimonadaceae bacterium]